MMQASAYQYAVPGAADSAYYKDYYAAYGYNGSYNMAAYYQQHAAHYAASGAASDAYQQHAASEVSTSPEAPPPPPPPVPSDAQKASATGSHNLPGASSSGTEPIAPSHGESGSPEAPPPPPPLPPPSGPDSGNAQKLTAATGTVAVGGGEAAGTSSSQQDAYAQWYAQNYGAYYSYPGYDQQWYTYWQQQQQQQQQVDAYGYTAYTNQQQPTQAPTEAPTSASARDAASDRLASLAGGSAPLHSYNSQPPPSGLYGLQHAAHHKAMQGRHHQRTGPTGPNTVPIGPRPHGNEPAVVGAPVAGKQQQPQPAIVIRPQVPLAKPSASAGPPSYISVDSSPAPAAASAAAASAAAGRNLAVAAAVAAGAASAMAAASAAKAAVQPSSSQWPPSFTAWVTRCFNTARLRSIPDTRLSEKLMAYLEQVKNEGKLWTTDWDTHPIMLPDGPDGQQNGGSVASYQVLSVDGTPGRKRNRWGAVPEVHAGHHDRRHSHEHHHHQHPPSNGYRKRGHDAESDEENHSSGERGWSAHGDGPAPKQPAHHLGGVQTMSNRKRKKLLQLEQQHQQASRRGGKGAVSLEEVRRQARAGRFGDGRAAGSVAGGSCAHDDDNSSGMDMSDEEEVATRRFGGLVVGTCEALEKSYFRLTSKPDPATVRPEPVLERALERLVSMIARGEASYFYSLDQFKGMRQDCTVQHLRNGLAVRVYEAHARSSLEYGDTAEFNQCQARLGHLYAEGQPGCVVEFTAYRVLYETVHCAAAGRRDSGGMAKSLLHTIRNIPRELVGAAEIRHALQVREAVMTYNYAAFFRLYATAPHLGRAIMDVVAETMRWNGLNAFVKACDLPLPVAEFAQLLGFSPRSSCNTGQQGGSEGEAKPLPGCMRSHLAGDAAAAASTEKGTVECAAWLREHGAVVVEKGSELLLDTKASRGKLFVPEVPAKVAHGDENLSVNDFLSQAQRNLS